jgi:hypothetical protein
MKKLLILIVIILFSNCEKRETVESAGIVLSRNRIPMPKILISFVYACGGKDQAAGGFTTVTNEFGQYEFKSVLRRTCYMKYTLISHKDSGSFDHPFQNSKGLELVLK